MARQRILTAKWPWVPSIYINLQRYMYTSYGSVWVNNSRVGEKNYQKKPLLCMHETCKSLMLFDTCILDSCTVFISKYHSLCWEMVMKIQKTHAHHTCNNVAYKTVKLMRWETSGEIHVKGTENITKTIVVLHILIQEVVIY